MMIFIEIYSQIHIFSEFRSKKRAKTTNKDTIAKRVGEELNVKYVLDLRDFPGDPVQEILTHDFQDILNDPEVEIVAEVMGGVKPAYDFVKACLENGKSVCTSNKELVAKHGAELLEIAKQKKLNFLFEASVGGGIPIIRPLNQSLTADEIMEITGILNGTTNYILTQMLVNNVSFEDALKNAQQLGYAEANPSADVDGIDACRKICILAALAYGVIYPSDLVYTEGIRNVSSRDAADAAKLGASIKLIGHCEKTDDEKVLLCVSPRMVPSDVPLYSVSDVFNGIMVSGQAVGDLMFYGRGAGRIPTAGAVLADIVEIVKHMSTKQLPPAKWVRGDESTLADVKAAKCAYYCRVEGEKLPDGCQKVSYDGGETSFKTDVIDGYALDELLSGYTVTSKIKFFA